MRVDPICFTYLIVEKKMICKWSSQVHITNSALYLIVQDLHVSHEKSVSAVYYFVNVL